MDELIAIAKKLGAAAAEITEVKNIQFEPSFRRLCEQNACGKYGKSWMCPPYIGPIQDLIAKAKTYRNALVYQTISSILDSYDFEGMMYAAWSINQLSQRLKMRLTAILDGVPLFLGAGACLVCKRCALLEHNPCRFPLQATPSLESYGINVIQLASLCGMNYCNGINTVTYFGAVLF